MNVGIGGVWHKNLLKEKVMHLNLFYGLVLLCFDETCVKHLCLIRSLFIIFLGFHIYHIVHVIAQLGRKDWYVK